MIPSLSDVDNEVAETLEQGRAVVALESTLLAHGLPWPKNLQTARDSESGRAFSRGRAGDDRRAQRPDQDRARLGRPGADRPARLVPQGRRDLSVMTARGLDAATTVSATLWIARTAGVNVMATGGPGGVHRQAGASFDVSTDLDGLARADGCLVVCSGVKSILDLPATLEALKTRGVAVVGTGRTNGRRSSSPEAGSLW